MLIRNFLVATWSLGFWVPAAKKPNILFIFTDDQAKNFIGDPDR